jgi:uncharacterized protein YbaR (Trm112 family)
MMKRWLMDLLKCPADDCEGTLDLAVFDSHTQSIDDENVEEIDEALITCNGCGRWYPVIDRITCMLPDDMRLDEKQRKWEVAFLERWKEKIPKDVLEKGIPFGLTQ